MTLLIGWVIIAGLAAAGVYAMLDGSASFGGKVIILGIFLLLIILADTTFQTGLVPAVLHYLSHR